MTATTGGGGGGGGGGTIGGIGDLAGDLAVVAVGGLVSGVANLASDLAHALDDHDGARSRWTNTWSHMFIFSKEQALRVTQGTLRARAVHKTVTRIA